MTKYLNLHPDNPQVRLIHQTVESLQKGQLIVYPTDSSYALGCTLQNRSALETIRRIRKLQENHPLTLMCSSIAQAAEYALIDDKAYHYFKSLTPGPYTFILPATKSVPKLVLGQKRKTVGIRIPNHVFTLALMEALGEPLLSASLWLPDEVGPIINPHDVIDRRVQGIDLIIDSGEGCELGTTVVDLLSYPPKIIRVGAGDIEPFEL